jgi:hypothetical protein
MSGKRTTNVNNKRTTPTRPDAPSPTGSSATARPRGPVTQEPVAVQPAASGHAVPRQRMLALESLTRDLQVQTRGCVDAYIVDEYVAALRQGAKFPRVVVCQQGSTYWLADGRKRCAAAALMGRTTIDALVYWATRREAELYAIRSNLGTGLHIGMPGRCRAVLRFLADPERSEWSNHEIGVRCGVDAETVARFRGIVQTALGQRPPQSR